MNLSQQQKRLWGKRLVLLAVVSLLIMALSGQMDLSDPFQGCESWNACTGDREGSGQLLMFILFVLGGGLVWHFVDEKK